MTINAVNVRPNPIFKRIFKDRIYVTGQRRRSLFLLRQEAIALMHDSFVRILR